MSNMDFTQATFEYLLRKRISEGQIPLDGSIIKSDSRYYIVNWNNITIQELWDRLIDEDFLASIDEDSHEAFFLEIIDTFTQNLIINDPIAPTAETKLIDLPYWTPVKNIPKKYYRG